MTVRRAGLWLAAALLACSVGAPPVSGGAIPVDTPPDAVLIGDSVMGALDLSPAAQDSLRARHSYVLDAKVCRRTIGTSCTSSGTTPTNGLDALIAHRGVNPEVLVVGLGYNDVSFAAGVDAMMAEARFQRIPKVIWVRMGEAGANANLYRSYNRILDAKRGQYPELSIVDWSGYSLAQTAWTGSDRIHLTASGARGYATLVADALDAALGTGRCVPGRSTGPGVAGPPADPAPRGLINTLPRPARFADTRRTLLPVAARGTLAVPVAGLEGVPADATAVVATITAVEPCQTTFLTAFGCGTATPNASVVNAVPGEVVANLALVQLGTDGRLCITSEAVTDVLVDITGWVGPTGNSLVPGLTDRLADTRPGAPQLPPGVSQTRLRAGRVLEVLAATWTMGSGSVVVNVAALSPSADGFLTVYGGPCSSPPPDASTVNYRAGRDQAASTLVASGGYVCVYSSATTDVIVDLTGYEVTGVWQLATVTPSRVLDTRDGARIGAGGTVRLDPTHPAVGAPPGTEGALVNITVDQPEGWGFVTAYQCASGPPVASAVNYSAGRTVAGLAVVGFVGDLCLTSYAAAHLIVDVEAWIVRNA